MVEYKKYDKKQLKSEMERLSNVTKYKPTMGVFDIFSKLPEYLSENEHPLCINGGLVKTNIWLIIPTNFRLLFIHKKTGFLHKKIDFSSLNYENITSIDSSSGLSGGEIVINTPHISYKINKLQKDSVKLTMDIVINTKKNLLPLNSAEKDSESTSDMLTQLERLGELKEKGVLTEDEFNTQKSKLLDR